MSGQGNLDVNRGRLADFGRRWNVRELALFGSTARGEARPDSDIDLMIEFLPNDTWDLLDLADMQAELADLFGRPVDLVEKGTVRNPYRLASIERDLTVLYAA